MDDARLLERARRGDQEAFSRLFATYQRSVFRYAAYMCGEGAADDIVQDTFLAILRQTGRHDVPLGTVGAYLFGIARHLVMKRIGVRHELLVDDIEQASDNADAIDEASVFDDLSRAETVEVVRTAVRALPEAYREVVILCELQEMPYAEAAVLMECPVGTVRSRLHRARSLLLAKLALSPIRRKLEV